MRAALLPTPGDPFMLAYWLRNFATWKDGVDELVVLVNGQRDPAVIKFIRASLPVGTKVEFLPSRVGHDGAIAHLLTMTDATHVVLCEDDAYVRTPGAVRAAFDRIGSGQTDLIGSPRHEDYFSSPLQEWGPYHEGSFAELRHGLWPAFLFARRDDLLDTNKRFGDEAWWIGDHIEGWGDVTRGACDFVGISADYLHLDTFFGTTFQLRAKGLRTELIHHVRLFDAQAVDEWTPGPWFHVTGLSTLDQIEQRDNLPDMDEHGGLWTRRLAWWLRTWHESPASTPGHYERGAALGDFMAYYDIPTSAVREWHQRFDRWAPSLVTA